MSKNTEADLISALEYSLIKKPYHIIVITDGDGYVARVEEWKGCITQADTWEELEGMIEDAMLCWLRTSFEDGIEIPDPRED